MAKYEQDTEMKSRELQDLKVWGGGTVDNESDPIIVSHFLQHNKAEVLSQLQEKTEVYRECETVVVEYMAEKERERMREQQEIREKQAAVKVY